MPTTPPTTPLWRCVAHPVPFAPYVDAFVIARVPPPGDFKTFVERFLVRFVAFVAWTFCVGAVSR